MLDKFKGQTYHKKNYYPLVFQLHCSCQQGCQPNLNLELVLHMDVKQEGFPADREKKILQDKKKKHYTCVQTTYNYTKIADLILWVGSPRTRVPILPVIPKFINIKNQQQILKRSYTKCSNFLLVNKILVLHATSGIQLVTSRANPN